MAKIDDPTHIENLAATLLGQYFPMATIGQGPYPVGASNRDAAAVSWAVSIALRITDEVKRVSAVAAEFKAS